MMNVNKALKDENILIFSMSVVLINSWNAGQLFFYVKPGYYFSVTSPSSSRYYSQSDLNRPFFDL